MLTVSEEKFLDDVFLTLKNYILEIKETQNVVSFASPVDLKKSIPDLSQESIAHEQLLIEIKTILNKSVRTIHPLFLNQLFGGFNVAAWAGEITSVLLNPTMATYEIAPVLTIIEKKIVAELISLLGFQRGEGIMVTGGSNANLLSMLCARTDYNPSIRQTGFEHNRFRVYVSSEAHYSFDKAANITGIGTQNLVLVPSNDKGEMLAHELEKIIKADLREGFVPIMVGATLGTTVLGAFDSLPEIARVCEKYKIWFHVDAAWGGGALFSKSARHLFKGIEFADSVTLDAHKTLGTPMVTSFFLTKHAGILKNTNRGGGAEYLFHEYDNSDWDTGTYSLQCGRRADALKLWLLWRSVGTNGIIQRTEHLLALAAHAAEKIKAHPRLRLYHFNYLNVCFQVLPPADEEINSFTLKVRAKLVKDGKALVNYAQRPDGTIFFRLVFPNHVTQKEDIEHLLDLILETADKLR